VIYKFADPPPREPPREKSLAGSRYLALIEQLALEDRLAWACKPIAKEDSRFARGWQGRVASLLGIDQSYVSRLWAGLYEPTLHALELAQTGSLRINYAFFHESLTAPHYRDFQRGGDTLPESSAPVNARPQSDPLFLGRRVREERLRVGMAQAELGRRLGLKSPTSMMKYEKGESAFSAKMLIDVADELGVTVDSLTREAGQ